MTIRCLLLDLDGTLADSLGVMRRAYERFLSDLDRIPDDAEFLALNGPPLAEVVRRLALTHAIPGAQADLLSRYEATIDGLYRTVPPSPGGPALLTSAKASGVTVGIVTSNSRRRTIDWLKATGLAALVNFVVGGEEAGRGKPFPDPYLAALERGGCGAEDAVAIEDSPQGVAAASGAGIPTLQLVPDQAHPPVPAHLLGRISRLDEAIPLLFPPLPPQESVRAVGPAHSLEP